MSHEEEPAEHFLRRSISLGDVITLVASLVVFSFGYGSLSRDVEQMRDDLGLIKNREITPGAAQRIAVLEAESDTIAREIESVQREAVEQRREILDALRQIDAKLEAHMDRK